MSCRLFGLRRDDVAKNENSHDADPYDLLYVVGAFDTICKTCQQQYCSAGVWTGEEFDKVGWRQRHHHHIFAVRSPFPVQ